MQRRWFWSYLGLGALAAGACLLQLPFIPWGARLASNADLLASTWALAWCLGTCGAVFAAMAYVARRRGPGRRFAPHPEGDGTGRRERSSVDA